ASCAGRPPGAKIVTAKPAGHRRRQKVLVRGRQEPDRRPLAENRPRNAEAHQRPRRQRIIRRLLRLRRHHTKSDQQRDADEGAFEAAGSRGRPPLKGDSSRALSKLPETLRAKQGRKKVVAKVIDRRGASV